MAQLTQKWRFLAFALNCATFYAVHVAITGRWHIVGGESVWVISAVGAWALGLLSAPWFRPPRDALAAAVSSVLIVATIDLPAATPDALKVGRNACLAYGVLIVILSLTAGFASPPRDRNRVQDSAMILAGELATGGVLFAGPALISIFAFYESTSEQLALIALWIGFMVVRPHELLIRLGLLVASCSQEDGGAAVGWIQRVDDPNILRVRLSRRESWISQELHVANVAGRGHQFVVPLYVQTQEVDMLGTGLCVGDATGTDMRRPFEPGSVRHHSRPDTLQTLMSDAAGGHPSALVGFVVEGSSIASINVELTGGGTVEEGTVIFCRIGDSSVYYQVLDAKTTEESFVRDPRGTHIATALQLGTFAEKTFAKFPWLPPMNSPVFLPLSTPGGAQAAGDGDLKVGNVPGTELPVAVNMNDLMEFHSAILGVTGTGKTELSLDLIRKALDDGAKVLCVDLTGEYLQRLSDRNPLTLGLTEEEGSSLDEKLFDAETGSYGAGAEKKVLKSFLEEIHGAVQERVDAFLSSDEHQLAIFELAEVTNTKACLRTTEMFLTEVMMWARRHRRTRRILIVLEEAHTTIPETGGAGFDYDTQWVVSRIGQIALQGRKYGVGLLLLSQRTALVSKTVLSQCNTYFVFGLVDQTSLGYLANVLSPEYVRAVPNLRFLDFVVSGKALNSDRPILARREFDETKQTASAALDA